VWKRDRQVGAQAPAAFGCDADEHGVCTLKGVDVCRSGLGPHEGNNIDVPKICSIRFKS